jgi:hypothetical protein
MPGLQRTNAKVGCITYEKLGPDPCLGYLPGVAHACCGHGEVGRAYVVFGEGLLGGERCTELSALGIPYTHLDDEEALEYFRQRGVGPTKPATSE